MGLLSTPRSRWVALAAVVALVAAAHVVQPLLLPWRTKFYLAIPGTFLYVATAWAALRERRWALWVCLGAPAIGGLLIAGGGLLDALGILQSGLRPDGGQFGVGLLQVPACWLSFSLLRARAADAP